MLHCFYLWPTTYECENKYITKIDVDQTYIYIIVVQCVYLTVIFLQSKVSTVDVAVVLPVEGDIDRAVLVLFFVFSFLWGVVFFVCFCFFGQETVLLYFRMTNSYEHYFCCFNTQANRYGQSLGR